MRQPPALNWLVPLVGLLALVCAVAGLFWLGGSGPYSFTTLRGGVVQMDGRGLYSYDTLFSAGSFRGADAVTLLVCVPLLLAAYWRWRKGSLRAGFLQMAALSFFLYNSISMAFGAAYNPLFLAYTAFFSASLFAFILAFTAFDLPGLPGYFSSRFPHRGIGVFQLVTGGVLILVWLSDLVGAIGPGKAPALLGSYTTMVTYAMDLGVIAPLLLLSGILLLRRAPLGYLLAAPMLFLNLIIGLVIIAQTIAQLWAGVTFTPAQAAVFIGSFLVMSAVALGVTLVYFRSLDQSG